MKTSTLPIAKGLEQTWTYMDKCVTNEGHLVIFDRNPKKSWDDKIFREEKEFRNKKIKIWGM